MKVKSISSRWLQANGRRLDCGPYMSGAMEAKELLQRFEPARLLDVTSGIYHAGRESRDWVSSPEHGVPFLGSTDILSADLSYLPFISRKQVDNNKNFTIRKSWILITRSGTTGRMAFARMDMDGLACSEHVMRVVADPTKILPGYLYAFLIGRFGIPMVTSGTYGSIIQSIEPHHIGDLSVPRLRGVENEAHALVEEASDCLSRYQSNVNDATRLFFESVGLTDITAAEWHSWGSDVGFMVTSPNQDSLRALNFNPRFKKLCDRIRTVPWKALGGLCPESLKRGGRYRRIDADEEHAFQLIGQKQIFWLRPLGRWVAKSALGPDVFVTPGTTLVAAQGTLGESELYCRSEFIWGKSTERAYSEHLMRAEPDESLMPSGALFAFMRSETAFRMLRSISMGSKLQDHHHKLLPELPIPYPPAKVQQEAHRLVIEAYELREEAVALEDKARTLVEQAIERGGH